MIMRSTGAKNHAGRDTSWMRRLGFAGFAFFFIKGILWLLIPVLAHLALFKQA
jgi:hypothetical protein